MSNIKKKTKLGKGALLINAPLPCIELFQFVGTYEDLINKYQNLNKKFYYINLPKIKPKVTLYHAPCNRLSITFSNSYKCLYVSKYDSKSFIQHKLMYTNIEDRVTKNNQFLLNTQLKQIYDCC